MAPTRRRRKPEPSAVDRPRLEALPRAAGYLLSIGPVIIWLDRATAEDVRGLLEDALARNKRTRVAALDAN
jgi:hypothetical protein